ncbi:MAG TPA: NADH-quinone oxidoreductase subunit NuoB [Thermoanaerobaculia bacterium]|nr:NADH-quinone oxidoreductase subunit NuoB [Thermoanaerobaculia bacterium]
MLDLLKARLRQGRRTTKFPREQAQLPARFRGRPVLDESKCREGCRVCADSCPTQAIATEPLRIDLGACLFCTICQEACPEGAIVYTPDHRLAARSRSDLVVSDAEVKLATSLDAEMRKLFGRSLKLRHVSAGDCSGCEAELAALGNVVFDLGRFGIQFVASPRHADGIVVTGPVTTNMEFALRETYAAVPEPKIVIAIGACAISGGPFAGADASHGGVPKDIPVDLYVPGCPPHPLTVLDGLLRLLGRLGDAMDGRPR